MAFLASAPIPFAIRYVLLSSLKFDLCQLSKMRMEKTVKVKNMSENHLSLYARPPSEKFAV